MGPWTDESLLAVEQYLPASIVWGRWALYWSLALAVAWLTNLIGVAILLCGYRRAPKNSWMDRARLAWPIGRFLRFNMILMVAGSAAFARVLNIPTPIPWSAAVLAFIVLVLMTRWPITKAINRTTRERAITWRETWRGALCRAIVYSPFLTFGLPVGLLLPGTFNATTVAALVLTLGLYFWLSGGGIFRLACWLGLAKPASAKLAEALERTWGRAQFRPRRVHEVCCDQINALAYPVSQEIAFTEQAVAEMNVAELDAIAAHELSHLREPKLMIIMRTAVAFMLLPLLSFKPILGDYGLSAYLLVVACYFLVAVWHNRLARRMEVRADTAGQAHEVDAGVYALALEKLYRWNNVPAVMPGQRYPHPHLYDRMVAAGITPEWPRPAPPNAWLGFAIALAMYFVLIAGGVCLHVELVLSAPELIAAAEPDIERALLLPVGRSAEAQIYYRLGWRKVERGEHRAAFALLRAAAALDRQRWEYPYAAAVMADLDGDKATAQAALDEAQTRYDDELNDEISDRQYEHAAEGTMKHLPDELKALEQPLKLPSDARRLPR